MNDWATSITLDVLSVAILGQNIGIVRTQDHPLKASYEEALRGTPQKALMYALTLCRVDWIFEYLPWDVDTEDKAATRFLREFCWDAIRQARLTHRGENKAVTTTSLLSKLIESNTLSDAQIVEQLLSIPAAG